MSRTCGGKIYSDVAVAARPINAPPVNVTRPRRATCRVRESRTFSGRRAWTRCGPNRIEEVYVLRRPRLAADFVRARVRNQVRAHEVKLTQGAHFGAGHLGITRLGGTRGGRLRRAETRGDDADQHQQTRDAA